MPGPTTVPRQSSGFAADSPPVTTFILGWVNAFPAQPTQPIKNNEKASAARQTKYW
jgi:hypothetical protein